MTTDKLEMLTRIPDELKDGSLFCLWRKELDEDGRPTKRPYNPHDPTKRAKTDNPKTFDTFQNAYDVLRSHMNDFDGLGRLVTGDYVGIDIDHVETDAEGKLIGAAADIVNRIDSYTEYSPSGNGLRIFCRADALKYDKKTYYIKHGNIEIYIPGQTNRYLTITGNVINDVWSIPDRSDELQSVLDEYMKRPELKRDQKPQPLISQLPPTQYEIIEAAATAKNGTKFLRLFKGQWEGDYPSQSEADQALCNLLAFYCQKDRGLMDAIFRSSGLYREKWEREDYREDTLTRAINFPTDVYTPPKKGTELDWDSPLPAYADQEVPEPTDEDAPPEKKSQDVPEEADRVQESNAAADLTSDQILDRFMTEITSESFRPIPTGIDALDRALSGGLERKTLVTLAAAPGAGKTAIAQYIFENMAAKGHNVVYVNLEMDRSQLLSRSISRLSHEYKVKNHKYIFEDVTALEVRRGYKWTETQRKIVQNMVTEYRANIAPRFQYVTTNRANPGHIDNTLSSILGKLEAITAELIRNGQEAPLVCIDYLQFIGKDEDSKKLDNADFIKKILDELKNFALKYNTVVLVITANNRASNAEGRASMDSGRDTSNIEYSGDVMLSLVYTAVEEHWLRRNGVDKNGNDKTAYVDNDFIYRVTDWKLSQDTTSGYPIIAKLLSLKVVKGRSIESRRAAKFIYDGRYFYFEEDPGTENPYLTSSRSVEEAQEQEEQNMTPFLTTD